MHAARQNWHAHIQDPASVAVLSLSLQRPNLTFQATINYTGNTASRGLKAECHGVSSQVQRCSAGMPSSRVQQNTVVPASSLAPCSRHELSKAALAQRSGSRRQ